MTQKELLYVEDAIKHENNIVIICEETINLLEDDDLVSFFEKELKAHQKLKKELINMLEVKADEWSNING